MPAKSAPRTVSILPAKKLLVANRSEIAIRIMRAATELGLRTVAIYAEEDRFSMHRFKADEAYRVGEGKGPVGAYLDIDGIVALAKEKGVDMIHPGYGFLSENAKFAKACADAGITFVGPRPELLELMGDKVAARALTQKLKVPTLPGTEDPVSDRKEALKVAAEIGFPLIIKAAFGGGGRGMRVVHKAGDLDSLLDEAQGEAERAFGNSAVFLEKYIGRAKHIEVQVLGDRHGNALHLHERDCSVQRRHQKVVEIAPSHGLDDRVRHELCEASVRIAQEIGYDNAGTIEFLLDLDTKDWFFIEMNPRIQVEHTVTEQITGIDLVRSQILIAMGHALHSTAVSIPEQGRIPRNGFAVQCRVTTEDPENKFTPNYGKIITYRSAGGYGVRLDAGMGEAGAVITPFYDSLLVKITTTGPTFHTALDRMDRAIREMRIRGVKTNIPFLENVIAHSEFRSGMATTTLIDTTPALFVFKPRRDRATKLLNFLGNITVNGNPHAKGYKPEKPLKPAKIPSADARASGSAGATPAVSGASPETSSVVRRVSRNDPITTPGAFGEAPNAAGGARALPDARLFPRGTRQLLLKLGPRKFAEWTLKQKRLLVTDTTFRDAHQSLMATRVRTADMLAIAPAVSARTPELFSLEMWGGATFDTAMRFLNEDPWQRLRSLRAAVPNICFQMLLRGANAVGYTSYPANVVSGFVKHAAECGMDIFRVFDSLNDLSNMKAAMEAVQETHGICEGALCYTGDILDPARTKYSLKYYVSIAKELEKMGAHFLAIKDMAGLCRPYAARALVKALKDEIGIPVHFHTHDTSGVNAASVLQASDAGVDVVDLAIASMSGSTSQPNMNSVVAALQNTPRETGLNLDTLNEFSDYWEHVRNFYAPFDTAPKTGSGEVYLHEMPGGQYTNLREQAASMGLGHRWPEIARCYREVNDLLGDIVKVTPSSKVVGDMALFLFTRGIKPADVVNLEPGSIAFPESVLDMLSGGLGEPMGGWPKDVVKAVLGNAKTKRTKPEPVKLKDVKAEIATKFRREPSDDDLYSHLMYPQVFADFAKFQASYSDVSAVPTPAFFYGLRPGEEVQVSIETGKVLFIKLINVGTADKDGRRVIGYELNGMPREATVADKSVAKETKTRAKASASDPLQIGAPIPGMVTALEATVGKAVTKGAKLATLEAMKMQTNLLAPADGTVAEVLVGVGEAVEAGDLMIKLRA